jgi:hypothetical protein
MKLAGKFLVAEFVWATGIIVLLLTAALMSEPPSTAAFVWWFARAIGLAAFPAGIAIAAPVFADARPGRQLVLALATAAAVGVLVFFLVGVVTPYLGERSTTLPKLLNVMSAADGSWESRNDAAWNFYGSFLAALNVMLFAAIGIQVGVWSGYSLPAPLRRALYWAVGLGLLISGYAIWDTTYETIVLHTAADVSFAAFYPVLIPASICAGLALPTLALVRRDGLPRDTS